jgi:adenine-specific DNA methylase
MSKLPTEGDMFDESPYSRENWVGEARQCQYKLESVRNSYVGNKRKMLRDFADILYDIGLHEKIANGGKVLDLFAGSAFVGYFFKWMGASVWSNELLLSSYLNSLILVEDDKNHLGYSQLKWLLASHAECEYEPCKYEPGIASKLVGSRFTQLEAEMLDRFVTNVEWDYGFTLTSMLKSFDINCKLPDYYDEPVIRMLISPSHYEVANATMSLLHMVMERCYVGGRLNKGQILAQIDHRQSHQRNEGSEGIPFHSIRPYKIARANGRKSIATNLDAMELLTVHKPKVDMIYIDPPYGGDQSDYAGMYSFFEEYLGSSRPPAADRFVKKKTYGESFNELLQALPKEPVWIFSYNDDSWANIDKIKDHLKPFGRREIIVKEIDYKYNYRSEEKASGTEYVIVAVP